MSSYLPTKEAELYNWLTNFKEGCTTYILDLGLTAPQLAQIQTTIDSYQGIYTSYLMAKAQLDASLSDKNTYKQNCEAVVREFAKQFDANGNISDAILAALGLPPHDVNRVYTDPNAPTDLLANPDGSNNTVRLEWKANGNIRNTVYVVEARVGESSEWTTVYFGTRTATTLTGATAGVTRFYRVFAQRRDLLSLPSNVAVIYSETSQSNAAA